MLGSCQRFILQWFSCLFIMFFLHHNILQQCFSLSHCIDFDTFTESCFDSCLLRCLLRQFPHQHPISILAHVLLYTHCLLHVHVAQSLIRCSAVLSGPVHATVDCLGAQPLWSVTQGRHCRLRYILQSLQCKTFHLNPSLRLPASLTDFEQEALGHSAKCC